MTVKLTLSADKDVVEKAKRLAAQNNTSVSAMFSRIILAMGEREGSGTPLGPLTQKAAGLVRLPEGKTDRDMLTEAVLERHGFGK